MQITRTEPQSQSQRARKSTKSATGGAYAVVRNETKLLEKPCEWSMLICMVRAHHCSNKHRQGSQHKPQ